MKKENKKNETKKGIKRVIAISMLIVILFLNFLRLMIQLGDTGFKYVNFSSLIIGMITLSLVIFYGLLLAFVSSIPLLAILYLVVYYSSKRFDKGKTIRYIILVSSIFGLFLSYSLYDISPNLNTALYPDFLIENIESAHPDDPLTGSFLLSNYGVIVGLIVGILVLIIYYYKRNAK